MQILNIKARRANIYFMHLTLRYQILYNQGIGTYNSDGETCKLEFFLIYRYCIITLCYSSWLKVEPYTIAHSFYAVCISF